MRDQISEFGLVAAAAGRGVRIATAAAAGVGAKAIGRRTEGKGACVSGQFYCEFYRCLAFFLLCSLAVPP